MLLSHWLNSSSIQIQTSNQKALDCTTDSIQFLIQDYLLVISSNQQLIAILEQQCKVNGCPAFCITVEHQQKERSRDFFDTTKNLHDKHHKAFIARLPDWTGRCPAVYHWCVVFAFLLLVKLPQVIKKDASSVPAFPFKSLVKLQSCKKNKVSGLGGKIPKTLTMSLN